MRQSLKVIVTRLQEVFEKVEEHAANAEEAGRSGRADELEVEAAQIQDAIDCLEEIS